MPQIGYFEPVPYRVRALRHGEIVVESDGARLLREEGEHVPVFCFPPDDVQADKLASGATTTFSDQSPAAGFVGVDWEAATEWFGEDTQLFGHPRDIYHRIDVFVSARHVRVLRDGEVLADTYRAKVLFETGLPPRYYLLPEDVRAELLPSATKTRCAYKGSASYYGVRVGDETVDGLVWTYPEPQLDALPVRDLLCFFNERCDIEVDGRALERTQTQWSES